MRAGLAQVGLLPSSSPEAQGISSALLLEFLEELEKSEHEMHGFVLLKNGFNVASGWWAPYRKELNHSMYSMSKSFTSTAVGFAIAEGFFKIDDPVISFFPDKCPANPGEYLRSMTVRDLLTMSVGHETDTTWEMIRQEDWVQSFLSFPVKEKPGSTFLYNSGATYMQAAIVQKTTGKTLLEFLEPRLFRPLGISDASWDSCPLGVNAGGWGLHLKTEDMAKFGQLYLQKGKWEGFRILPEGWAEEATSFKIQNGSPQDADHSDWAQGYCYQFWRSRHNSFRGDGAFGQYTLVLPEQNAVLAIHSETPDMQGLLNIVWDKLLPGLKSSPLPQDTKSELALKKKLQTLSLQPPRLQAASALHGSLDGRNYAIEPNDNGVSLISFKQTGSQLEFSLQSGLGQFSCTAGWNAWRKGETNMPGTPPNLFPIPYDQLSLSKSMGSAGWKDDNTLVLRIQYFETAHHDDITCTFDQDRIEVSFLNSIAAMGSLQAEKRAVLKGSLI
jgi:hypothetical protein